jgi:hypothetical protein
MSAVIRIDNNNAPDYFSLQLLIPDCNVAVFDCAIPEYNVYLKNDALHAQSDLVALTWLLKERSSGKIVAYMSLIADAIKLSLAEKELHNLNYPFKTLPAMKIAKLAVSNSSKVKYSGVGTYMIEMAAAIARISNTNSFACRFITVDADIEHDIGVAKFYQKNDFIINSETNSKTSKMVNMRKDLYL